MDLNKLKSRLHIKFQPIQSQRKSLKKLEQPPEPKQRQKQKHQQSMHNKIRSNSQIRLPSLHNRSKARHETLEDSKSYINASDLKERAKSFKEIPKVKLESKEAINSTITYLMKNEILNVPRLVALLQKNQSDQFIYLKMSGIYEFEACDQREKGNAYVTVSKNGMVQNGELITLQTLAREFELWKKLKKIDYFRNYHYTKYLQKWKEANKRKRFEKNRENLSRELHLKDKNFLQWRTEIFSIFNLKSQGGWLSETWIHKLTDSIKILKQQSKKRLIQICFKMLENFNLPISESTELLNRVLGNLGALNISFQKKIRIQKECQKFYKLGRQLELSAMERLAMFILTHLRTLTTKVQSALNSYSQILQKLSTISTSAETYTVDRQKILSDSAISMDIDYTLFFNPETRALQIRPSPQDIFSSCMAQIKIFIKEMDRIGFRVIRTEEFGFVSKNVFKGGEEDDEEGEQREVFRFFVIGWGKYEDACHNLEKSLENCETAFAERITLYTPFLNLYLQYLQPTVSEQELTFHEILSQYEKIQESLKFCSKLDEGEYFILGFLKTSEYKKQLISLIKSSESQLFKKIPLQISNKRNKINTAFNQHLAVFNAESNDASSFIRVGEEVERVEENLLEYSALIQEIEKIQEFYYLCTKNKLNVLQDEKKNLNELKIKMKAYIESRQTNFLKYRKSLETYKTNLTKKIENYGTKEDIFYDPHSNAKQNYNKLNQITRSLKAIENELTELNRLENYYNLKPTSFMSLDMLIKEYESLEEIWRYTASAIEDEDALQRKNIRNIAQQKYIKHYQLFKKKSEKYLKDSNLQPITQSAVQLATSIIQNLQTIQLVNSAHLRQSDLEQINYLIERKLNFKPQQYGTIKCRNLRYGEVKEFGLKEWKGEIAEIVFKAKKEIEIVGNIGKFNQWWKGIKLDSQTMEQYPMIVIFGENLKLRDEIDQYTTMLINILNNKYGNFIRAECNKLLKKLTTLAQLLQLAQSHQQKFLNLFPILTSKYAQSQLAAQYKKFEAILSKTMRNMRVLIKPTENLTETTRNILLNNIKNFDALSSTLSKFLESKRIKFQRFYFLQDYELLEVLVGIADERNVFRMFEGIKGWLIEDGIKVGVVGIGDEKLLLKGWNYKNVEPQIIFRTLEDAIKANLNSIVRNVLYQYEVELKELKDLYEGIPWMCLYAVEMILYTKQVELNCFHEKIPLASQESLLREALTHSAIKPSQYSNHITLLLHLLHFTEQLRKNRTSSIFSFEWHSFLRFYYEKDNVLIRAMSNEIRWGGEYQGMWDLMVYTSDIRRAHLCVVNGLQYANGVLLQGPSGTGKTESLKELARCTAKYCVIFNCSQNVNLRTVGKLLSGLCYTASWLCLDEINRLTMQAMSSIAKQIQSIRNAILSKKQLFNFMGKDIKLRPGVAIFSTMNPIYLKRAKLTENIKSYFRTITVAMPQHETILEVLLYGLKFYKPRELAHKIGNCFGNLSIQLAKNAQYDFGLRAMKFLIGNLSKRRGESKNQNELIAQAFYDIFLYRLTPSDKPIFEKIISDIFNYLLPAPLSASSLHPRIVSLQKSPQTGAIVFGPVSIKSRLIKQYCSSFPNCEIHLYNPNSADMQYFLGGMVHGRWEEGVVERVARLSLGDLDQMQFLVLDSTLKSEIIQNFNTLLDESKLLTLSNGTRLKIHNNLKILMETPHLNLTSPSTITRCNVVYVCDKDVQTHSLIDAQLPEGLREKDRQPRDGKEGKEAESVRRIRRIYGKWTNAEIRDVGRLTRIIIKEREEGKEWKESQVLGVEKAVIFAARILGIDHKIKQFINKDNSFHLKKSPFHHILTYERYSQGEFLQISRSYEPISEPNNFTLKTSLQIFAKWLTRRATSQKMQPILWKGHTFQGKTKALTFSLKGLKYTRISLNKKMSSSTMAHLLLPQILDKRNEDIKMKEKPQLIIYVENLHMANEQLSEQIRFMMESNMIFSVQVKEFVSIQALAFVAESRHFETRKFDRVRRHFSQVTIPQMDQVELKNIYYQILKHNIENTSLEPSIKNLINIESERLCIFLASIYSQRGVPSPSSTPSYKGPYEMARILERARYLSYQNCKQIGDFVGFMFEAVKVQDRYGMGRSIGQEITGIYHGLYAGKFGGESEGYLRGDGLVVKSFGTAVDSPKKDKEKKIRGSDGGSSAVASRLESMDKSLYISNHFCSQIEIISRILQSQGSHMCLFGSEGSGRKTLFRSACKLLNYTLIQLPQQLTPKQTKRIYYERLTKSVQSHTRHVFLVDLKNGSHIKFLQFVEAVALGTSVGQLFDPEQTDYMFGTITDFIESYSKSMKSYEEVCEDYVALANNFMQLALVCPAGDQGVRLEDYPSLYKKMYQRVLPEYPIESLLQCIHSILEKHHKQTQTLRQSQSVSPGSLGSLSIQSLPRMFMKIYKVLNILSIKNGDNELYHFAFNQFHIFRLVELFLKLYEKNLQNIRDSQDVLNRSITKIADITKILNSLRQQISLTEPQVSSKRTRILQVAPILQQKKSKTETIKYALETERKEIQLKTDEISTLMKEVEEQIAEATPLLNQAVESIQTIKRNELSEIKNNTNPHPLVKFTMENMVILLGESQSWDNIRKVLSDANLLIRIKSCQPSHESYARVKKRLSENPDCTFESISKISFGARYLFKWIKSIIRYKDIEQSIQRKKQYVEKLKVGLKGSEEKAAAKMAELAMKEKEAGGVQGQYARITKELNELEEGLESSRRKLLNAEKIKNSLEENFVVWEQKLKHLKQIKSNLTMYSIQLALDLHIYPSLTSQQLSHTKKELQKVFQQQAPPHPSPNFRPSPLPLLDLLTQQKNALSQKLNHEDIKDMKKVMLAYHFCARPLILDPDNLAVNWIGRLGLGQRVVETRRTFPGATKTVEQAMKYGSILIVLIDSGELDTFSRQILRSLPPSAISSSQQPIVEYNKNTFPLSPDFQLLFCCKARNPVLTIAASLQHQVINFQITKMGLQQFLMESALRSERLGLWESKNSLQGQLGTTEKQIQKMQSQVIQNLLSNKKNLIEDESLINLLSSLTQKTIALATAKASESSHLQQLQQFSQQFSPLCSEVADIFISIKEVSKINSNLVWDLEILARYFVDACESSIGELIEDQEVDEGGLEDEVFGVFQFQEVQGLSRPTTALSNMSLSLSRLASQQNEDPSQVLLSHRTQKPEQQPFTSPRQVQETHQLRTTVHPPKPLLPKKTLLIKESQRGQMSLERLSSILTYLLDCLKKAFTEKERYVWALLLALKNEQKEDLRALFALMGSGGKKRNLQMLLDQNMLTENLKNYFARIEPSQVQDQARRLITQTDNLIGQLKTQPSIIETLMVGQAVTPEHFLSLTQKIIKQKNFSTILEYEELKVSDWLQSSDNVHPILLLMGEDPIQMISQFLERKKYKNATLVAMGEEQGKGLDQHIQKQCRKQGLFIIHNFHIGTAFMPILTRLIQQFSYRPPDKNFRLVLISSIETSLPTQLVSLCHKYIVCQPSGLKNKMADLYKKSQSLIDHSLQSQHKLTYSLCLMHSIVNEMHRYGPLCWNFPPVYTTSDFVGSLYAIKAMTGAKRDITEFLCNIDREEVEREIYGGSSQGSQGREPKDRPRSQGNDKIDFVGLRYLIGQICYVGKLSDNIDRRKMRIIVQNHFNQNIMRKNYIFWQGSPCSDHPQQVQKCIQAISQQNPKTCGLHEQALPSRNLLNSILRDLSGIYFSNPLLTRILQYQLAPQHRKFQELPPIEHRLGFIVEEINNYNANGVYLERSRLLGAIDKGTRVFDLRAFGDPRQLFVAVKLELAVKHNVPYDGVVLLWGFVDKEGCYGVTNLTLEGGGIKNGHLVAGVEQKELTVYFWAVLRKKDKDPNKGKVAIPLYSSPQRGESIDNYGENTNLLTQVYLESKESAENWVIKGTAFVVG